MKPFWSGRSSTLKLFVDEQSVTINVQQWSIAPFGTEAQDSLCGDIRAENQTLVEGYNISITCLMRDAEPIRVLLANTENDDLLVMPFRTEVGLMIKPLDGTAHGYSVSEVTIGLWELAVGGQSERATVTIPMKARFVKKVALL